MDNDRCEYQKKSIDFFSLQAFFLLLIYFAGDSSQKFTMGKTRRNYGSCGWLRLFRYVIKKSGIFKRKIQIFKKD